MLRRERSLELIDTQSGGDVSRIVVAGIGPIPGATVREKARYLQRAGDGLRRLLLSEPYGDPAMSVDLIVEPGHPEAQAGYVIMEAMGYPMYSGSNTICTATALLQSGAIPMREGVQRLVLESPAGLARIDAVVHDDRVESITTQGEPAYVEREGLTVDVPYYGEVRYDLVWSGAHYALIDAAAWDFRISADEQIALTAFGDAVVRAARPGLALEHPDLGDVGPLSFAHFTGPVTRLAPGRYESPSATYVHPGVLCRSPTGTGTSARLALMHRRGEIAEGESLETISPRGNRFVGTVRGEGRVGGYAALHSVITGQARLIAHSRLVIDLEDPLVDASDMEDLLTVDPSALSGGSPVAKN
ncbi:proline racemase [Tsukamurella pulmonis]|uniref:Proline racemase n=1 Tax=Tsukamurella pulmonis TaxID=47312 RepID=A0A1H1C3R7_9ACTN|nr:proline racemase family protein [Tsukamurella pulmonis]KXO90079.1 proline racemase [Tsukamurella pulmonis]SDQ58775.1 Proline racemase [Tsukamurella pulmonis]SUP24287.1 proline racemase [Tsukamurella pulmonis]